MAIDYVATLEKLSGVLQAVDELQAELKILRETVPDDAWDALADGPFGDLLAHCLEIEHQFES